MKSIVTLSALISVVAMFATTSALFAGMNSSFMRPDIAFIAFVACMMVLMVVGEYAAKHRTDPAGQPESLEPAEESRRKGWVPNIKFGTSRQRYRNRY